jgi:Flp pilus assembly protein TadD
MFRQAIKLNPNHPKFYNNLGIVLEKANLFSQAAELFGWAIKLDPNYTEALNNFGTVFIRTSQFNKAEAYFRHAIELNPYYAQAYNNLALVLENTNRRDEALKYFRRAIELEPNDPILYNNLGKMLKDSRQLDEAEACFQHALNLRPDFVDADFALAILYLLQEQYEKGWEKYDDLRLIKEGNRHLPIPQWRGEALAGRRILLYADQGFGDTIHFVRYAQLVANLASETSVLVQKPLERLLGFSLTNCKICNHDSIVKKEYDFACPLLSLPHLFNTSRETIPQTIPYLQANRTSVKVWRDVLDRIDSSGTRCYRIGVVWAGNSAHNNDRNRSIPFDVFRSLFDITDVSWISLQVGKRVADLTRTFNRVIDISDDLIDFAETAGVIANLDLVITVDSAVAHLAGALGQKTWLLLPFNPDWRWQLEREDSPWYPTLRLFRQHEMDTWSEVVARVKESLVKLLV